MLVVVSYDVSTVSAAGRRRLRRVAKACTDWGQRVQDSVFECLVDPTQWAGFRSRLLEIYEPAEDSLRFYFMGSHWKGHIEHHGIRRTLDLEGPLIT
jgi:CRISPR-associated protein Cas2